MNYTPEESRDLNYYKNIDKVYWFPLKHICSTIGNGGTIIKANVPTPCIFVEEKEGQYYILQFDESIEFDQYRYTAWRKFLGIVHGVRINVLLIHGDCLYTLNGDKVLFKDLKRSNIWINKEYLAKYDIKSEN